MYIKYFDIANYLRRVIRKESIFVNFASSSSFKIIRHVIWWIIFVQYIAFILLTTREYLPQLS